MLGPPPDRHADHGPQRRPVGLGHVAAAHLAVVAEGHRAPPGDDGARHALAQREHAPRLAGDADVGLLAVHAGGLVDQADRAGVALQELDRALQDALQQRAQRELGPQVLDDGLERGDALALARAGRTFRGPGLRRWRRAPGALVGAWLGQCMRSQTPGQDGGRRIVRRGRVSADADGGPGSTAPSTPFADERLVEVGGVAAGGSGPARRAVSPTEAGLAELLDAAEGYDRTLLQWRLESCRAARRFVESLLADPPSPSGRDRRRRGRLPCSAAAPSSCRPATCRTRAKRRRPSPAQACASSRRPVRGPSACSRADRRPRVRAPAAAGG